MSDPDSPAPSNVSPADVEARRKAVRDAIQAVGLGVGVSIAAMVGIWVLFSLDLSLLLVLAFFGGVAVFATRIAKEERALRDRTGR